MEDRETGGFVSGQSGPPKALVDIGYREQITKLERKLEVVTKALERSVERVMGIKIDEMNGDNLAVTICTYFDNPDQDGMDYDDGWGPDATKAYEAIKQAISDEFEPVRQALKEITDG